MRTEIDELVKHVFGGLLMPIYIIWSFSFKLCGPIKTIIIIEMTFIVCFAWMQSIPIGLDIHEPEWMNGRKQT